MIDDQQLILIPHAYEGEVIRQRTGDGYINATAMCKAGGKQWNDYWRLLATGPFIAELSAVTGIPVTELIQSFRGGTPHLQGTWIHPQVAINLAQWVSPKFAVKVSEWVVDWMTGRSPPDRAWQDFEDRISLVYDRVPVGYFCIFKESADLFAALITGGVSLGSKILLDVSVGQHWSTHWKSGNLAVQFGERMCYDNYYPKHYPQAWSNPQDASCYPEAAIPVFRLWMREVYIPMKLPYYLKHLVKQGKVLAPIAAEAMQVLENHSQRRALPRPSR